MQSAIKERRVEPYTVSSPRKARFYRVKGQGTGNVVTRLNRRRRHVRLLALPSEFNLFQDDRGMMMTGFGGKQYTPDRPIRWLSLGRSSPYCSGTRSN
jgi:hypothetical protein